jgi:hypothetical protein
VAKKLRALVTGCLIADGKDMLIGLTIVAHLASPSCLFYGWDLTVGKGSGMMGSAIAGAAAGRQGQVRC